MQAFTHGFRQKIRFFLFVFLLLPLLSGCRRSTPPPSLFGFLDSPASFTAVFPPPDETAVEVKCAGRLSPKAITLTVVEPERSAGLTIRYAGGHCTLEGAEEGGTPIPLSEKAAEPLTAFLRILTAGNSSGNPSGNSSGNPDEAPKLRKSASGEETVLEYPNGRLLLRTNESGEAVPSAIESPDAAGNPRTVSIESWRKE